MGRPATVAAGALDAVHTAYRDLGAIRERGKRLAAKLSRVKREGDSANLSAQRAAEKLQEKMMANLLEGRPADEGVDLALVGQIKQGDHVAGASKAALQSIEMECAANASELAEAQSVFAGAVFALTTELQAAAATEIIKLWPSMAPAMAQLLAIDEVRARYCGDRLKLSGLKEDRPWSGTAIVRKLAGGIPDQLAAPAIALESLLNRAKPLVGSIIEQIEGE
jgi:hypothetical protein